jgi:thermitase
MKKSILIGFREGAKPQEIVSLAIPSSRAAGATAPQMERLFSIAEDVSAVKTSSRSLGTYANDDELFDTLVYPTKEETEKKLFRTYKLEVPDAEAADVMAKLQKDKSVEFVQFDELNELYFTPNDPLLGTMYGMTKIQAAAAWDLSQGSGVIVAVIDTGVDYNHPDIVNNMARRADGTILGWDMSDNDADPKDYHSHGSHCAGTIAATFNNNRGVAGVAPQARIMPLKIFPNAIDSVCANALKWAVDNGAKILSNSWGPMGRRASNPVVEAAIDYVHARGGICVFAAGNNNDDVAFYSPANHAKVISVGATDSNDARATFSNWGPLVDIAAPGVNILSLRFNTDQYMNMSGTSMSCPHVAGAVALLVSLKPTITFDEAKAALWNGGNSIATDKAVSGKRLNAYGAILSAGSHWISNKKIQGMWTNTADKNAWVYVESFGWKKISTATEAIHMTMLIQLISAKESNRAISIRLVNGQIVEIYN